MKVLLTGATGFIGSALVGRLLTSQRFVVGAAVRRNGDVVSPGVARFVVSDLAEDAAWRAALTNVHAVVHLAARVHVMSDGAADPLQEFRRTNVTGTLNLAARAAAAGVRRFVFMSSIKVHGESTLPGRPYTVSDIPAPIDPYAVSKLEAENGLRQLAVRTGMELVIVRPPLVYGPHVKGNFLRLLYWVERGIPLPFANVENRRSLLNVRNLVDLVVQCLEHPAAAGETFLPSDGQDISTADLVRRLAVGMDRKPRLFPIPLTLTRSLLKVMGKDNLWQRLFGSLQINCGKAKELLGWTPPIGAIEGLEETGRWHKHRKNTR